MLEEIKQSYHECASGLGDYSNISKTELANKYCKAVERGDELLISQCFSALILRYWFKIGKYYQDSKSAFSIEDCYEWLVHALLYALKTHPWLIPGNSMYNDPNGPDKVINRCIISTRQIAYQHANTDRSRITHSTTSLDRLVENLGDSIYDYEELCEDDHPKTTSDSIVKLLLNNNNFLGALIIDGICNQEVFKEKVKKELVPGYSRVEIDQDGYEYTVEEKDYKKTVTEYSFANNKLTKHLLNINNDKFIKYFSDSYAVDINTVREEVSKVSHLGSTKLNKTISTVMDNLRKNK